MLRDAGLVVPLAIALAMGAVSPATAESAFNRLVNTIERRFDVEREKLPAGWLVNTVLFVARPAGVKHMEMAIYPEIRGKDEDLAAAFQHTVAETLGHEWRPWVRSRSLRGGEWTAIYVRPSGKNWEMMLATVERGEASVIKMKVDVETMARYLRDHTQVEKPTRE